MGLVWRNLACLPTRLPAAASPARPAVTSQRRGRRNRL